MQALCATSCNSSICYANQKGHLGKDKESQSFQQQHMMMRRCEGGIISSSRSVQYCLGSPAALMAAAILTLSTPSLALAATPSASLSQPVMSKGAALFQKACIGCHDMGGNILQPGATLFNKDLERNGVDTEENIYNITYYGKGRMPGFGEKCTPRGQCTFGSRLQEDEIKLLAEFVKSQADRGWPNIEIYGD